MKIGEAATRSGLSVKTIRYYESIGLVNPSERADNGYREYSAIQVDTLHFLQRARATGFSVEECRQLLDLYRNEGRHSAHVKNLVLEKVAQLDQQLQELQSMRGTLMDMADRCAGNEGPNCAIIDQLAESSEGAAP